MLTCPQYRLSEWQIDHWIAPRRICDPFSSKCFSPSSIESHSARFERQQITSATFENSLRFEFRRIFLNILFTPTKDFPFFPGEGENWNNFKTAISKMNGRQRENERRTNLSYAFRNEMCGRGKKPSLLSKRSIALNHAPVVYL